MSEIALTSAMRTNLLTLQSTQEGIDKQQEILATGRKVNSALDNPSSFFASQSLTNRSNDLSRLLDGMGQNISAIKQADKGVTSLTKLVEQADAIANQALTTANETREAKVTGDVDVSGITDMSSLAGVANDQQISIDYTDANGASQNIASAATGTLTIEQFVASINANGNGDIEASLTDSGELSIKNVSGGNMRLEFTAGSGDATAFADALGLGNESRTLVNDDAGANQEGVTFLATNELVSVSLRDAGGNVAQASETLGTVEDAAGASLFSGGAAGDNITIGINGGTAVDVTNGADLATLSIQEVVDNINSSSLSSQIEASYDDTTGQLSIRATDSAVESIEYGVVAATAGAQADFGFGQLSGALANASDERHESIRLGSAAGELAKLESDFDAIRGQIDQLVQDTGYQGVNLLNGDNLTTAFNEDRSSSITTQGVTFDSTGLGISAANFGSKTSISGAMTEVRDALTSVRQFGSTLANDLAVIQTRQDFTKETINNLKEGSDKLTLADKNEEGAKLLALQTQQQLGVISLSMASQSSQSVLRLF